ncbi:uncharacterized protein LOC141655298 [Silene latifolia]|uniref:uncharacterized protein LOC141655298 n=1 Tax=Silene latifolia TaxID=37657 RepID=UPI003D78617E
MVNPNSNLVPTATAILETSYPMYLHPAESARPILVDTKLSGIDNYFEWKRQMEIALCTKRKLGMLTGLVKKPTDDPLRKATWITCNSQLIAWILHNVEPPIRKSVMYTPTAKEIWDYLQRQFSISNGARKFRLNKELEDLEQGEKKIGAWLEAHLKEQNERKLFQFLNGLNSSYFTLRSNILMMSPLPSVKEAAAILQQEEAQRKNYKSSVKVEAENAAFYAN